MILWLQGCEACFPDAEPCPDQYHQIIHDLMRPKGRPLSVDKLNKLAKSIDVYGRVTLPKTSKPKVKGR